MKKILLPLFFILIFAVSAFGQSSYIGRSGSALGVPFNQTAPNDKDWVCYDSTNGYAEWCSTIAPSTFTLPSLDADPAATAGRINHDITVTGITGGAIKWNDGTNVRTLVDQYTGVVAPEVNAAAGLTLSSPQVSRTIINNYGQAAADINNTLPAASAGLTFISIVGTQVNNYWRFTRAGADTIIFNGTTGRTWFQETNQTVGSRVSCFTFQTGAATWTWVCASSSGTWVTD